MEQRWYRALAGAATTLAAMICVSSAMAQSTDDWKCTSARPNIPLDERISSCNSVVALEKYGWLNRSRAYSARAKAYLEKGEVDNAIADFGEVIKLYPESPRAYYFRADAYSKNSDYDRAIVDYSEVIRRNPLDPHALFCRGIAYVHNGELDQAIADFDQAIQLAPLNSGAYVARGSAFYRKGDLDRAFSEYEQALRLDPRQASAFGSRAFAYMSKGEMDRAIADYDRLIELSPKNARAYRSRAVAYLQAGPASKSLADFDQSGELDPKDAYTALWRDVAARRSNQPSRLAEATRDLDMSKWPAPIVQLFLGDVPPEAVFAAADSPNGVKKRGQVCEANFFMGELALQRGEREKARQLFQVAAAECPKGFVELQGAIAELKAIGTPP